MNFISRDIIDKFRRRFVRTCPFCFTQFATSELCFRCSNSTCSGRTPDHIFARAWGLTQATVAGRVLQSESRFSAFFKEAQRIRCDRCDEESITPICPHCHYKLPPGFVNERSIAIIGGSNTGKSHYIAVLIDRLKREIGPNFHFSLNEYTDETRIRYKSEFYNPLFTQGTLIQITTPAQNDPRVRTPLIFRITFDHKHKSRTLNLYFFDTAGEDMKSGDTLEKFCRYIINAHGIIFLLDPLQIAHVHQQLPAAKQLKADPQADPEYIVGRVRELFEQYKSLSSKQKITTPIAFTLSKIDEIIPLLDRETILTTPKEQSETLDLDDVDALSEEIESYLNEWINRNFCEDIENKFKNYRYFGVSSLGKAPENKRVIAIKSLRVEEPFLWIMCQLKFIKGMRRRS